MALPETWVSTNPSSSFPFPSFQVPMDSHQPLESLEKLPKRRSLFFSILTKPCFPFFDNQCHLPQCRNPRLATPAYQLPTLEVVAIDDWPMTEKSKKKVQVFYFLNYFHRIFSLFGPTINYPMPCHCCPLLAMCALPSIIGLLAKNHHPNALPSSA